MTTFERVKGLCKNRGTSIRKLEEELGFGNGSLARADDIRGDRVVKIAEHFNVTTDFILGVDEDAYYANDETAATAQAIYENRELSLLFDAAKDAKPEDLMTAYNVLLALKRKDWSNNA